MKFGVGVLGATGYIGTPYRKEIRESPDDATIVALHGRRWELLEAAGKEDRAKLITDDWRQVVEHPDVNLVLVCTPDAYHYEAVMRCAELKKHIVCEKPVAVTAKEAGAMWRAIREANVGHYVPFWTRYVPTMIRTRQLVQQGVLGDIRAIVYRWHNPRPANTAFTWRDDADVSSAGSVADVGSHAYDVLRWITGLEAIRTLAHADAIMPPKADLGDVNLGEAIAFGQKPETKPTSKQRKGSAYDYASIAFELSNGAVATLVLSHASYLRKVLAPELELHGTEASLAVDRVKHTISLARPGEDVKVIDTLPDPGNTNRFQHHTFPGLRDRISSRPTDHPGLDDGYHVQLFTDAAAHSARAGKWVTLAEIERE